MKHLAIFLTLGLFSAAGAVGQTPSTVTMIGFTRQHADDERRLEARFDSSLRREDLRPWMKKLSAHAHHTGSPYCKENAEFIASQFRSFGLETSIEQFDVLFPTPKTRILELTGPTPFRASLAEPAIPGDSTSGQLSEQLPTYNAYSIDGDVTGQLVYVNFGVPKDYEELARRGIDVKGKIVIARYFGSWRGIKPKVAAEHGAIGCIIYSDPKEDGYYEGDVYPKGPYRSDMGAQRGSVADMPLYAGDPLTPFVGATKSAKRLPLGEAKTLTKIPVLPISYKDAMPFLSALGGPVVPESWRGALPLTYHFGPGPATAHLKLEFNWNTVPAYDVIGMVRGTLAPDQWVIRGNHHDAWVYGADDPVSGQIGMMEEAKGIGNLLKTGWKPKRTMVYCAWDGEEPGLLGSTEWVEAHADALRQKAVVYINSDSNGRGFLGIGGSHTLEKFITQVSRDVLDPETHVSVYERARAQRIVNSQGDEQRDVRNRTDLRISALGSGSDFTPFLQHLGISALNFGFGGEDGGGDYHSIYDSYSLFTRFYDTSFIYGITSAQTGGRMMLRLANADILPFSISNFTETVQRYMREVTKLTDDLRTQAEETNQQITEKTSALVNDPREFFVDPKRQDKVPYLNFTPLQNALSALQQSTATFDKNTGAIHDEAIASSTETVAELNALLTTLERALTNPEGLPGRPWYIHEIYAPGRYTGYGVKTLPAMREAIEQKKWKEAETQIGVVADVLQQFSKKIDRANNLLEKLR
jgi:N-acetylated-alpha-linked acidic dipeptidase